MRSNLHPPLSSGCRLGAPRLYPPRCSGLPQAWRVRTRASAGRGAGPPSYSPSWIVSTSFRTAFANLSRPNGWRRLSQVSAARSMSPGCLRPRSCRRYPCGFPLFRKCPSPPTTFVKMAPHNRGGAPCGAYRSHKESTVSGGDRERLSPRYALPTKPSEASCDIAMSAARYFGKARSSSGVRPSLDRAAPVSPANHQLLQIPSVVPSGSVPLCDGFLPRSTLSGRKFRPTKNNRRRERRSACRRLSNTMPLGTSRRAAGHVPSISLDLSASAEQHGSCGCFWMNGR